MMPAPPLLPPRPAWMHPLPADPPPAREALDALYRATEGYGPPGPMCRQCYEAEWEERIRTIRDPRTAPPRAFSQIHFEHPECSGGIDTIKRFAARSIETLVFPDPTLGFDGGEPMVTEKIMQADAWFWHDEERAPLRDLTARLFVDWFAHGRFAFGDPAWWRHDKRTPLDNDASHPLGLGMEWLAQLALFDSADLVHALHRMGTARAEHVLIGWLRGGDTDDGTYSAADSMNFMPARNGLPARKDERYIEMRRAMLAVMSARRAHAVLGVVTGEWLGEVFFRRADEAPDLAEAASDALSLYNVHAASLEGEIARGDPPEASGEAVAALRPV